jgi:hypothetical protein
MLNMVGKAVVGIVAVAAGEREEEEADGAGADESGGSAGAKLTSHRRGVTSSCD